MEASDAAEQVVEAAENRGDEKFRSKVALAIAVMAMLLAITSLGGGNAAEEMLNNNIHASDTWNFFQAKNMRQTVYKLTAEELESELQLHQTGATPETRQALQQKIDQYKQTVARYESEPDPQDPNNVLKGEGKKQLMARAQDFEKQRDVAIKQDPNFDFAEALFQIAIVLASVAILSNSRQIMVLSLVMATMATGLMLNGFFLFISLPF